MRSPHDAHGRPAPRSWPHQQHAVPAPAGRREGDLAMTAATARTPGRRAPWWQTASWAGLLLLGAFNLFAVASDLAADAGTGLPGDHAGTFTSIARTSWASFRAAQPGAARYITLLERGYAVHELVFALLFLVIVAVPLRARQWWAWWACWIVLIAYLGYTLGFGLHDPAILPRSLIGLIALPVFLLAQLPALARSGSGPRS
jgi:hypothetical protein